jgi:hypothetical protein
VPRDPSAAAWIRTLAQPYLKGYRPVAARRGSLRGYWFLHPASALVERCTARRPALGFFVGYLVKAEGFAYLEPAPPECLVFAFVEPVGGASHRRLVADPEGLVRKTSSYIRWLTHRPPRFAFFEERPVALVRHISMRAWPREKYDHFSRNFFIETLAWFVRSAVVRKLLAEAVARSAAPEHTRSAHSA